MRQIVINRAGVKDLHWFGSDMRFAVHAEHTGGRLGIHIANPKAGTSTPPHCHGSEDEFFYLIRGSMTLETPGASHTLEPGDFAYVPRGITHRATHDTDSEVIVGLTPGTMQSAFRAISARPDITHESLRREMSVWGVEFTEDIIEYEHPLAPDPEPVRIVRRGEGQRTWLAGDEYTTLLSGRDTQQRFCVVHFLIPPGGGPVVHQHNREEEVFIALDQPIDLYANGALERAEEGDALVLPRGIPHAFRNSGPADASMLAIVTPAGFDDFITEAGRPARPGQRPGQPDDAEKQRIGAVAPKYGITILPEIHW